MKQYNLEPYQLTIKMNGLQYLTLYQNAENKFWKPCFSFFRIKWVSNSANGFSGFNSNSVDYGSPYEGRKSTNQLKLRK